MSTRDPGRISDYCATLEGGVDSGVSPDLIQKNQLSWAVNSAVRGGWSQARPGWLKCAINWQSDSEAQAAFEDGLFQVGGVYESDGGNGFLMCSIGGRQFSLALSQSQDLTAQEITIPGDRNSSTLDQAWCCQAENYWILQNDQAACYIFNGATARRATPDEIPTGRQMTYAWGRVWVAKGREYVGGNIVYGPDGGNPSSRASMLLFTENTYLREGGAFAVPANFGEITGFKAIGSINTALGQGELITYTQKGIFATQVPQDRTQWGLTSNPLQRIIQLRYGTYGQNSIVDINEDHYYRSPDGIRSLVYSVRNSGQPGNTSMSHEVERALDADAQSFLRFASGTLFDNRLLMTCAPQFSQSHGVYHRGLVALDFHPLTSIREKTPPTWDGVWVGLNILQIVTVFHQTVERCFVFVLNTDSKIEVWEVTKEAQFDNDGTGDRRIVRSLELRSMNFGQANGLKELTTGDIYIDNLVGTAEFNLKFRNEGQACWVNWEDWIECAKYKLCSDELGTCPPTLADYKEQYRPKHELLTPTDAFDPILSARYRSGYTFQMRLTITGSCRVKAMIYHAQPIQEPAYGNQL